MGCRLQGLLSCPTEALLEDSVEMFLHFESQGLLRQQLEDKYLKKLSSVWRTGSAPLLREMLGC